MGGTCSALRSCSFPAHLDVARSFGEPEFSRAAATASPTHVAAATTRAPIA
jgi:hypothetical protein